MGPTRIALVLLVFGMSHASGQDPISAAVNPTGTLPTTQADPGPDVPAVFVPVPPKYTDDRPLRLEVLEAPPSSSQHGALMEWRVRVEARYDNPFDPRQVRLEAELELPDGSRITVPGFFAVGFDRTLADAQEVLTPAPGGDWFVRFRPWQPGPHVFRLRLANGESVIESEPQTWSIRDAETSGMIRVSPQNPQAFAFVSGASYVPIGLNLAWPNEEGTFHYDRWFAALAENGGNFARIWLAPNFNRLALDRFQLGVGQLDMTSAWKIDYLLRLAERHGIHLMLCIEAHGGIATKVNPAWHENPYNAANGGPCEKPTDFWTDAVAQERFRHKLRYLVARYGDSPSVFAWEFFNEVYHTDDDELYIGPARDWHERMARYLRSIDPYGHLITTSGSAGGREDLIDEIVDLDVVQTHAYRMSDTAEAVRRIGAERAASVDKPHVFGEIGIAHEPEAVNLDTQGIHFHNQLWAGVMTPSPGTTMAWWWDHYIEPRNLWWHFKPVSQFLEGVPVAAGRLRELEIENLRRRESLDSPSPVPLRLAGSHSTWQPHGSNRPQSVTVDDQGRVAGAEMLSTVLHGTGEHIALQNPVTFNLDFPTPGTFTVVVEEVSGWDGAGLTVLLDDQVVLDQAFVDADGLEGKEPIQTYNGRYTVAIPAGSHRILVRNPGNDWVQVRYEIFGPLTDATPALAVHALALDAAKVGEPAVIAWLRNRESIWSRAVTGEPLSPVPASEFDLTGIPDGDYQVQWWDSYTGTSNAGGTISVVQGRASLSAPEFERDIALRLIRLTPLVAPSPAPLAEDPQPQTSVEPAAPPVP